MKKEGEGWSDGYVMNVWSMKGVEANEREQRDKLRSIFDNGASVLPL